MRANLLTNPPLAGAGAPSFSLPMAAPRLPAATPRNRVPKPGLFQRIDDWFWRQREREIAVYLATSQNVYELEQRMRDLSRGTLGPCY
jgi:hypothetical protein